MIQAFDFFNRYETPEISLHYPDRRKICDLGRAFDLSIDIKFNSLSQVSFTIPNIVDGEQVQNYNLIKQNNKIHIENLGWFIIQNVKEESDGVVKKKTVPAYSEECFMNYKSVNLLSGVYQFYSVDPSKNTIMSKIMGYIPDWSIGTISSDLWNKYRTFDVTTSTLYSFITGDVSDAYECFFVFDTENKLVSVYNSSDILHPTSIILSFENLVKSITIEEKTDEYVTALSVTGGGDLDITSVNPLGGNYIYDFSYPINQHLMSSELEAKVITWQNLVNSNQTAFANKLTEYKTKNSEYITLNTELTELKTSKTAVETVMKTRIDAGITNLSDLKTQITSLTSQIALKQTEINTNRTNANTLYSELQSIVNTLSIKNNFTGSLYYDLLNYIVESTYQNENITKTSTMTNVEVQTSAQSLYDQGKSVLSKIAQPRYSFSITSANFIFLKEYINFTNQLVIGSTMRIYTDEDTFFTPVLQEIKYNYDDPSDFSLTFGNRLKLDDAYYSYSDLIDNAISAGNSVNVNSSLWNSWSSSYESDVSSFINSALDASKNEVLSSSDAEITISSVGLKAQKKLGDGTYDPNQLWLTPRTLAFTTDGWDSVSTAIGKITLPDSSTTYGVVGEAIVGNIIASESLIITNSSNNFTVNESGATLTNSTFTLTTTSAASKIILNPSVGFKIQKNVSGTYVDQVYLDSSGNATFKGSIVASGGTIGGFNITSSSISSTASDSGGSIIGLNSDGTCRIGALSITKSGSVYSASFSGKLSGITEGTIGGWTLSSTGLTSPYGDYIKSDGTGKLGLLTYNSSSAVFTGNVYANNIAVGTTEGYITGYQIGSGTVGSGNLYKGDYGTQSALNSISADVATLNSIMVGETYATMIQTGQLYVKGYAGSGTYYPASWRTVSTPTGTLMALTHT